MAGPNRVLPPSATTFLSRRLLPSDREAIRLLHEQWFPIRYPDQFFVLATSMHNRLQSECLIDPRTDSMAALLVWRHTTLAACEEEDRDVAQLPAVAPPSSADTNSGNGGGLDDVEVVYVLTVGVVAEYRQGGLGTRLVRNLIARAEASERCRSVYLHVLTTNTPAIRFYEKLGFARHKLLKGYYDIGGARRDAFTYVYTCAPPRAPNAGSTVDGCLARSKSFFGACAVM